MARGIATPGHPSIDLWIFSQGTSRSLPQALKKFNSYLYDAYLSDPAPGFDGDCLNRFATMELGKVQEEG
jgi:hypothetical protein